ncbi:arginase family protein [Paenibacillus sp. LS1]|uniref:arginase family protein n=1 Tax=Paenibacillus sp. LS1 TaxID=2992120 RepID=UPI00223234FD|nr:arginase family protein [Paenibacillus sp. LS1]MCW3792668.1 arginase family protein [Paenibacillus sp. LS1]
MSKTIRLLMPQWQGGVNPNYTLGAELLAWLAPDNDDQPLIRVPVHAHDGTTLEKENGIPGRKHLMDQLKSAELIINAHKPDRIIMFGGDCLVEQAPFAYLNERYGGELALLYIDAHSDLVAPNGYDNAHAIVLGNLIGEGHPDFAQEVKIPINPNKIFLAGLGATSDQENELIERLGIRAAGTKELDKSTDSIKEWIKENNIKHLAIHLDLDVLDPKAFRSLLFANPEAKEPIDFPMGEMLFPQLINIIKEISGETEVVGLGVTEHLPWDSINLKNLLSEIPILNQ